MASIAPVHAICSANSIKQSTLCLGNSNNRITFVNTTQKSKPKKPLTVVAAVGDVSADGTIYLIGGAVAVALIGTAFPLLFSRKDLCPECDGAGYVRKTGSTLRVNAARKDELQIVCARCNGLGKLNQVDKK